MGTALLLAYKVGEMRSQMAAQDYYITRVISPGQGMTVTEYVTITENQITFTQDENLATPMFFWDALNLKTLIRKFNPGANLKLETANQLILA